MGNRSTLTGVTVLASTALSGPTDAAPSPAADMKFAPESFLAACPLEVPPEKDGTLCRTGEAHVVLRHLRGIGARHPKDLVGDLSNQGPSPFDTIMPSITLAAAATQPSRNVA